MHGDVVVGHGTVHPIATDRNQQCVCPHVSVEWVRHASTTAEPAAAEPASPALQLAIPQHHRLASHSGEVAASVAARSPKRRICAARHGHVWRVRRDAAPRVAGARARGMDPPRQTMWVAGRSSVPRRLGALRTGAVHRLVHPVPAVRRRAVVGRDARGRGKRVQREPRRRRRFGGRTAGALCVPMPALVRTRRRQAATLRLPRHAADGLRHQRATARHGRAMLLRRRIDDDGASAAPAWRCAAERDVQQPAPGAVHRRRLQERVL